MCRSRGKVSTGGLNWAASATAVKSRSGLHRQEVSSASGKFYAMMQQVERPSEGADLHHLAASALPRHGAGTWSQAAGPRATGQCTQVSH